MTLAREMDTLYVDLAVWGPHANRSERLWAMEGVRLDSMGKLVPLIMYGPANIMDWVKCYRVWRSMAISKWFLKPEMTDRYSDRMNKYAHDYPAYL